MSALRNDGWSSVVTRLAPPEAGECDAELLGRYLAHRTEDAFAALVHRHGPMVLGVCRRRLGRTADADDAFQVTFMVLARDATKIGNRESLPGWLYRVAFLVALKMSGKQARLSTDPLPDDHDGRDADPVTSVESLELRRVLDEEIAALPDKLRAVVLLCGMEELTNAEAAKRLGCPKGTVDSRLSAARAKLRNRLARRGWPAMSLVALDTLLRPDSTIAREPSVLLAHRTIHAAVAYATSGGAATDALTTLANGVSPTMSLVNVKLLVAAGMSLVVLVTAGLGLIPATADEPAKPKPPAVEKKPEPPKKAEPPAAVEVAAKKELRDEVELRTVLASKYDGDQVFQGIMFKEFLDLLHKQYGLNARIDTATFKRIGLYNGGPAAIGPGGDRFFVKADAGDAETVEILKLYETMIQIPVTRGMTVADLLSEAVAQLPGKITYCVRGNQILIIPAFIPPATPGAGATRVQGEVVLLVEERLITERVAGEPVSISIESKSLTEVVKELRKLTGANIVIDTRCKDKAVQMVSGGFDDVRLFNVLTVLSDMCDLKPAYIHNVYYITTPENADKKQKDFFHDLYGKPETPSGEVGGGPGALSGGLGIPLPTPVEKK